MKYGEKVVAQAQRHVGTREIPDGSNMGQPANTGFIDLCQRVWNMGRGTRIGPQPWCAMAAAKWYSDAGVDDQNLFSPSTAVMCSNASRYGIREIKGSQTAPPGSVIIKCGIHMEVVVRDRGNGTMECIGGNVGNAVQVTSRRKSDWRIFAPEQITKDVAIAMKTVFWFEDVRKQPKTYGGWMTQKARDKKIAEYLKGNPTHKDRIRKIKSVKGIAKYKFQVMPPKGSKGGVSNDFATKALRDKAAKTYEAARGYTVRRRSRRIPA